MVPNARNKSAEFFFNVFKFDAINCSLNFIVFGLWQYLESIIFFRKANRDFHSRIKWFRNSSASLPTLQNVQFLSFTKIPISIYWFQLVNGDSMSWSIYGFQFFFFKECSSFVYKFYIFDLFVRVFHIIRLFWINWSYNLFLMASGIHLTVSIGVHCSVQIL